MDRRQACFKHCNQISYIYRVKYRGELTRSDLLRGMRCAVLWESEKVMHKYRAIILYIGVTFLYI